MVAEILEDKREQLRNGVCPMDVQFALDEVQSLQNKEELMTLRWLCMDSMVFCGSEDVFECAEFAVQDDTLGGVLEYVVLRNPTIRPSVMEVFPGIQQSQEQKGR